MAALVLLLTACTRQDARLQQHKEAFESLGATTASIARAWLDGDTSGTFTRTALTETLRLVEQERAALAATPAMLLDERGAKLSQEAEKLSRVIAQLTGDVQTSDGASARRHLADIPIAPQS